MDRASVDQAKADASNLYGQAATQVAGRAPGIQAAYDKITADIRANAQARAQQDAAANQQRKVGMQSAANAFGFGSVPMQNSSADAVSQGNMGRYLGNAESWAGFNDATKLTAVAGNQAQSDAFTHMGLRRQDELENQFLSYLQSLSGGGGGGSGGGGGGGGYDDEALVEYPTEFAPMGANLIRGQAANTRRLSLQGDAYKKAGLVSADGKRWLGPRAPVKATTTNNKPKLAANPKAKAPAKAPIKLPSGVPSRNSLLKAPSPLR